MSNISLVFPGNSNNEDYGNGWLLLEATNALVRENDRFRAINHKVRAKYNN